MSDDALTVTPPLPLLTAAAGGMAAPDFKWIRKMIQNQQLFSGIMCNEGPVPSCVWARVMCLFDPLLNLTLCTLQ